MLDQRIDVELLFTLINCQIKRDQTEVMTNGNLIVRGEKQLALSEGSEVIRVSGVVRVDDIAPNGTVTSKRLASAQFSYRGSGDMASATQVGWGTRLLTQLWPF